MAQSNQELVVQIKADLSKLQKGLDGAEQKAKGFKNRLAKIGDSLKQALNFGAIFAGGAAVANAFNVIKDFDQATANLAAVTGKTTEEIQALTESAKALGASTAFTASEVSGLQTELAKLGFRENDILKLTKPILNLAQATGSDLANAAALAGSVVQSFGLEAKDTVKVVDIMTKSFTASALDIRKFEVGIRQVAPVAKTANVSLSEVTSMLGVLANNGVRAESAGVGLRNIMLEAAKRGVPFKELLDQVSNSSDKSATAMQLFGKENAAVGVILAENTAKASELNTALLNSAGTAQDMADKQLDTLTGALAKTKSAWEGFVLSLESGEGVIANVVIGTLETVQHLLQTFSNLGNYLETVNPFKSIADYSKETLDLILDIGRSAESGEEYAKILSPLNAEIESMDLVTLRGNLGDLEKQFRALLTAQGDDLETVNTLWARFKERAMQAAAAQWGVVDATDNTNTALDELDSKLENNSDKVDDATESVNKNTKELNKNTKAKKENAAADEISYDDPSGMFEIDTENLYEDVITDEMKALDEQMEKTAQKSQLLAVAMQSSFSAISSAIRGTVSDADTAMGRFVRALAANAIEIIGINLSQSLANAITGATQSGTASGPAAVFTTPAFIASAIGGIIGAFAAIPKFASGGIVNGSSFSGDRVMARVNSGEMILNRSQQANLFGMINRGGGGNERLVTQIAGNDLRIVLERAQKTNQRLR